MQLFRGDVEMATAKEQSRQGKPRPCRSEPIQAQEFRERFCSEQSSPLTGAGAFRSH
jgi:hypothetical protein